MSQLYAFRSHFNTKKDEYGYRAPKINQDRDAWAMHLLIETLRPRFDVVLPGFNTTATDLVETSVKGRLRTGDFVLTSTRLGINDLEDEVKTPVPLGNNWLEERILDAWRRYVRWCSRKRVQVTEEGEQALGREGRHLTNLEFADTDDASFGSRRGKEKHTAGYIICIKELWPDGPGCISVFGMSGTITLGFASILRERWSSSFINMRESELVVAEIVRRGDLVPASVQGFPDFWKNWTVYIQREGTTITLPAEGLPSQESN